MMLIFSSFIVLLVAVCLNCFFLFCRYHNGDAYIIDVSQSVEHDHPHALEFLRKDCSNVNGKCVKTSNCMLGFVSK